MPTSVSPYSKSYPESDSETTPYSNNCTNPTQIVEISTKAEIPTVFLPIDSPRRSRSGHRTSHSFNSVRDRRPRINSRSSDRSSSEPPAHPFDLGTVRTIRGEGVIVDDSQHTNDSDSGNGNLLASSFQNQSYRRLIEANSSTAAATTNSNIIHKSGSVAITGGHSNSRHASGDSSPKGKIYFQYLTIKLIIIN